MHLVPVDSHKPRDEKFVAQLIVLVLVMDVFDRVLQEQGVAGWFIDDTIEDVGYYFALQKG